MLLTLISAIAETESLALSENIKWGLRRKYESGSINSVPLGKFYGFDKIDGKLIVNEEQAAVVRRIYKEFLDGHSFTRIAERLTADGIPTETGNCEWNISCLLS
jgi:DNA invertase Pin-like site-specific DNA recombinase